MRQKNKITLLFIIIFLFICNNGIAQNVKEILQKTQQHYLDVNFNVQVEYQLFKGVSDNKVLESYIGFIIKDKDNFYTKILNTETIFTKEFYLKLNHNEKALEYILSPQKDRVKSPNLYNISAILNLFEKPKMNETDQYWHIELITKEYSSFPISKMELDIDKKDYNVLKQVLIYSALTDFSEKNNSKPDYSLPRLVINYKEYKKNKKSDLKIFDINRYFLSTDKNNVVFIAPLNKYEINAF